jgi:hypothetical protein
LYKTLITQYCLISASKWRRRPCYAVLLARVRQRPCAEMRIVCDLPVLQQRVSKCCTGRAEHKIGYKRKGRVDFALFNMPRMPNP